MTARSLDIIMALGAALALLLGGFAGFAKECDEIPSEVLRLHIPANSDSPRPGNKAGAPGLRIAGVRHAALRS